MTAPQKPAKPRRLELDMHDLRRQDSPHVFVLNTSDLNGRVKGGVITLPVLTTRGTQVNVTIYNTFIPQDLSRTAMKTDLVENVHFMRLVDMGRITIVNDDWAKAELKTSDARLEADRLRAEITKMQMGLVRAGVDEDDEAAAPDTSEEAGVNAAVIDIVAREDLSEVDKWSAVKRIENSLTEKDLKYIVKKTDADRLKAYANNRLLAMQGKDRTINDDE